MWSMPWERGGRAWSRSRKRNGQGQVWESKSQTAKGFCSITSVGATALSTQWGCEQRNLIGC